MTNKTNNLQRLAPSLAANLECRIARFHLYAHEYKCHVLMNTVRSEGWGNMIGEENESDWSTKTHLVASTRVMSAPRRLQRLDDHAMFIARLHREKLGTHQESCLIKVTISDYLAM